LIYGERIRLRAPEREDLPKFVDWLNDPEVREGISIVLPFSQAEEEIWFDEMIKRPAPEHPMAIEIREADGWTMVGTCGFHEIYWRNRSAEVGILIGDKTRWNLGYGTEVMRLLLNHGFQTLNLNRISLQVFENNPRAIRTYKKVGFRREGVKRQAMYLSGQYHDIILMSVLRSEWKE